MLSEPWAFWWELCEMARRLLLVGIFVTIEQGSVTQIAVGTAFSVAYMLLQMQTNPYAEMSDDYLANGCSFALSIYFLCCIIYKIRTLTELRDVQGVMSKELKSDFSFNSLGLSFVLIACVVGALVASFAMLLVQLARERKRMAREARASKMRRLRLIADDSEVQLGPPIIPPAASPSFKPTYEMGAITGTFHIFLSHVWGTAQDQVRIVKTRLLEMLPDAVGHVFLDVDECASGHSRERPPREASASDASGSRVSVWTA